MPATNLSTEIALGDEAELANRGVARVIVLLRWVGTIIGVLQAFLITGPRPIGGPIPMLLSALALGVFNVATLRTIRHSPARLPWMLATGVATDLLVCALWSVLVANQPTSSIAFGFIVVGMEGAFITGGRGVLIIAIGFFAAEATTVGIRSAAFGFAPQPADLVYLVVGVLATVLLAGALADQSETRRAAAEAAGREARVQADALRRRSAELDAVLNAISDLGEGVVRIENDRVTNANPAFCTLMGYTEDELRELPTFDALLPPETRKRLRGADWGSDMPHGEADICTKSGEIIPIEWGARTSRDGTTRQVVAVVRDARERRRTVQMIEAARDQAEKATRAKSEYLSRISHELRTPLTAILGFAELLAIENPRDDQLSAISAVSTSGAHLRGLIDDVLDISRIESGRSQLEIADVDLGSIVGEAVDLLAASAREHRVTVITELNPDTEVIAANRQALKQVLINLLSNAIKFNRRGGDVVIRSEAVGDGARVRICVSDSGPGIPQDRLDSVFEPFERLSAARLGIQGAGLGLALVRELVNAMQGQVSVTSEPGMGTTFAVEFAAPAKARS